MLRALFRVKFLKFIIVAASYNIAAYCVYAALVYVHCNYLLASSISFIFGVTLSYFMNKSIVFANNAQSHKIIVRYLTLYMTILVFNLGLLHFFVSIVKLNPYFAQIVVVALVSGVSYNAMRMLVFKVATD